MTRNTLTQNLSVRDGQKKYVALRSAIRQAGLLKRSYKYYAILIVIIIIGFFGSGYSVVASNSLWAIIVSTIIFAFFSVQLSGLQHDAGHRAVFSSTRMNDFLGRICGALLAMGYSSWKLKHNIHHAHTNQEDMDPDVDIPVLSFTPEHYKARKGLLRLIAKYQAFLYYPIGSLVSFSVRLTSLQYFISDFKKQYIGEIIIFGIGLVLLYAAPFLIFPILKAVTFFLVLNFAVGFYLLNVFAPNHKGMPTLKKNQKFSFLEQQIVTSRNIVGSTITDFIYMGLNYQIEHHLFPDCPRNNLKRVSPYIKRLCKEINVEYTETGVIESNKIILSELHGIARQSRQHS